MVSVSVQGSPPSISSRVLGLLLLLTFFAPAAGAEGTGRRYALLIGVNAYQQWPSLVNPVPDVRALGAELQYRYGFLPEVLENPTREDVIAKLRRYFHIDYGPQDQLVVVFAGHGTYDEVSRIGYLVAADSEDRQRDPNFVSLLNYPWLLTLIDNIDCPNILLVVDACYSGSLAGHGASATPQLATPKVRRFLTSGGTEYVPDGDPDRHTPFMSQLLAGLRSPSKGSALSIEALQSRFMSRVEPRPRWGSFGQNGGKGDLVFVAQKSGPAPTVVTGSPRSRSEARVKAPQPAAAPSAPPRLRSKPKGVAEKELERAFYHLDLFDKGWNPEGDSPNELRVQSKGLWDVVVDLESGLMWQQSGSDHRMSSEDAAAYVSRLNREGHAGYRDWRLPTVEELASLLEPERQAAGLFVSPHFDAEQETCWSADWAVDNRLPYYVSFNSGRTVLAFGGKTAFVRAVRSH